MGKYDRILNRKYGMHNCGDGFRGRYIKARGVIFCEFCGHIKSRDGMYGTK